MQGLLLAVPLLLLVQGGKLEKKDVKVGKGPAAAAGDICTMNYTGKLTNGKEFDSSLKPGGKPFVFVLGAGQVIKGWDQGIVGMKPGGKRKLTIPSSLGYGDAGMGQDIPPKSTLVFDVELLDVFKPNVVVLKKGMGDPAMAGDMVTVHYKGMLKNGKVFDQSYGKQPMPVQMGVPGLIVGFQQGMYNIKQGEKRKVTIPAKYAYGSQARGEVIPANSDLIFELEAVSITKGGR